LPASTEPDGERAAAIQKAIDRHEARQGKKEAAE